ncbi:sugar transferase [Croceivirga sp. JEA036]|uniref:sugar transferase n=1 Tax=Croceivirga sp. JEA036 TaxID=2721162 RepID=UPI00143C0BA2|nr:sugar transferase [Croceivirga sp. JEA036]NJB35361.1 sugar transferase [Croceivirga sp. JEA036]
MYKHILKRAIDFTIAIVAFVLLSPIFLIVTLALLVANNGEPFFTQQRPGYKEKIFKIIKFRSMNNKTDNSGNLLPDEDRITKVGAFVRKTSLDEIPQLINVIKGDMSLIGPRPLLVSYLPLYNTEQKKRHRVKPGITGWAQVNGRNAISWQQKFIYDVWYVENVSLKLDIKIMWLTLLKVIKRSDISSTTSATMEVFEGN